MSNGWATSEETALTTTSSASRAFGDQEELRNDRRGRQSRGDLLFVLYGLAALAVAFACIAWALTTLVNLAPPAPMPECPNGTRLYAEAVGVSRIAIPLFHCFNPEDRADIGDAGRDYRNRPRDIGEVEQMLSPA